jgi:hypothetical protein
MHYNSIKEYFLKLQNRSLILFLMQLMIFITAVYLVMMDYLTIVHLHENGFVIALGLATLSFGEAISAFVVATILLKKAKIPVSLGERLDRYAHISWLRLLMIASGTLMMMVAFYLTGLHFIVALYLFYLIFFLFAWPTRSRLCSELSLKKTEEEVIREA